MSIMMFNNEIYNKFSKRKHNFAIVGYNTGNLLFWTALKKLLQAESHTVQGCRENKVNIAKYDAFITTDLIWIRENTSFEYVKAQLEIAGDKPLIPISVGLQSEHFKSDFKIHPTTVRLLKALEERAVLGLRGYYTAEILDSYGIKNVQVIGCPSLYYNMEGEFSIIKGNFRLNNVACNFRSFHKKLSEKETHFLAYCSANNFSYCEQTMQPFTPELCNRPEDFKQISEWLQLNKFIFFDIKDWISFARSNRFSIGSRFHGNVVSLWNRIPALFIKIDSRTQEMTEFFNLPTISLDEFDSSVPIEYYYELADYDEFNASFPTLRENLINFFKKNHLIPNGSC